MHAREGIKGMCVCMHENVYMHAREGRECVHACTRRKGMCTCMHEKELRECVHACMRRNVCMHA